MFIKPKSRASIFSRPCLGAASILLCILIGSNARADSEFYTRIDISSTTVEEALYQLAEQGDIQILFDPALLQGLKSKAVKGVFTRSGALKQILDGHALQYSFTDANSVLIKQIERVHKGEETTDNLSSYEDKTVDELVVTGSRLRGSKPSSTIKIIYRDQIERMGIDSVEDILRVLPQNFFSVNSITTALGQGESPTPYGSSGTVAANLRGMGAENTLVLVNGRRLAGSSIYGGDGTINLSKLPVEIIERVEILLDGASAIYGSDAMGGVINFILKKGYNGATTKVRYENSRHDADSYSLSQSLGVSWESGSLMAVLSHSEIDSTSLHKAGYDTSDFRSRGGYDRRRRQTFRLSNGEQISLSGVYHSMGNVFRFYNQANGFTYGLFGALPKGTMGSDWDVDDLSVDNVPAWDPLAENKTATVASRLDSIFLNYDQELENGVQVFGELLFSTQKSEGHTGNLWEENLWVPFTNPFATPLNLQAGVDGNGDPVPDLIKGDYALVAYHFGGQRMPYESYLNTYKSVQSNIGAKFTLPYRDWQFTAVATYGSEELAGRQMVQNELAFQQALAGVELTPELTLRLDDAGDLIPAPALNPFTNEHDPALNLGDLFHLSPVARPIDRELSLEFSVGGSVINLSGGDLNAVMGMQHRIAIHDLTEDYDSRVIHSLDQVSAKLKRSLIAGFYEISVPFVGSENALPGIRSLVVNLAGRWESYHMRAQFEGAGSPKRDKDFNKFSPKVSVQWEPVEQLQLQLNWGKSFKAPSVLDLAEPPYYWGERELSDITGNDTDTGVIVKQFRAGNPDLRPVSSTNISLGVEWSPYWLPGLYVHAAYYKQSWKDKFALVSYWDPRLLERMSEFPTVYVLDQQGVVSELYRRPLNLASSIYEFLDIGLRYSWYTNIGGFHAALESSHALKADESLFDERPLSRVATIHGPDQWKVMASIGWSENNIGVTLYGLYSSGYLNSEFAGNSSISPVQSVDSYYSIDLAGWFNPSEDLKFTIGLKDLFNRDYPFVDSRTPYDGQRVDVRGRRIYMSVSKNFSI